MAQQKAELMQLMAARDDAQQQLRDIKERLGKLGVMLGEPKANKNNEYQNRSVCF